MRGLLRRLWNALGHVSLVAEIVSLVGGASVRAWVITAAAGIVAGVGEAFISVPPGVWAGSSAGMLLIVVLVTMYKRRPVAPNVDPEQAARYQRKAKRYNQANADLGEFMMDLFSALARGLTPDGYRNTDTPALPSEGEEESSDSSSVLQREKTVIEPPDDTH